MLTRDQADHRTFLPLISLALCLGGSLILFVVGDIEAQASRPSGYTITDLTVGADDESWAWGINSLGQAVGASSRNRDIVPFFFDGYSSHALPTLDEFGGVAYGINTRGDVVGYVSVSPPTGQEAHAVVYTNGELHDLGTLGGTNSFAYGINDAGEVVGVYQRDEELGGTWFANINHAFLYTPSTGIQPLNMPPSIPLAINTQGEIVGGWADPTRQWGAFLYAGGAWRDLGEFGASAINDSGWVVGTRDGGSGFTHAVLYRDGAITDIHASWITGHSQATGIDSAGQIVGYFDTDGGGSDMHAFLYSDGTLRDLNTLIPKNSGWWLQNATAINGVGQIVGYGMRNGRQRGFLLTPKGVIGPSVLRIAPIGRTTINASNRYSEDTAVQAEMIFPADSPQAGQIDRTFQGEIEFSESPGTHYYDGLDGATRLPLSVNATNGIAAISLSSVSVSATGVPPPSAFVTAKCTGCTSAPAYPNAIIPQWVDGNSDGFIDWLESWANDLLRNMKKGPGEVGAVTRLVSRIEPTNQSDQRIPINACGYFLGPYAHGGASSVLHITPNCGSDPGAFRRNRDFTLSEVILHESRHAWQFSQVTNPRVDVDADLLCNSPAQFLTPIDPEGIVPVAETSLSDGKKERCNYIEERCTGSFGGSGRDDVDDRLNDALRCTALMNPEDESVRSCAWESDAYSFGRAYKRLFP
jgi:probable HAF family extracellular repeat protein